jgi:hypothetical protein
MTIAIAVKTPEGIVLGTDSTTSWVVPGPIPAMSQVFQLFNSAQKIFEFGPSTPTFVAGYHFSGGITTYGDASCGPLSWRHVVSNFYREVVSQNPGRTDLPQAFLQYVQDLWQNLQASGAVPAGSPIPDTGFLVGYVAASQGNVLGALIVLRSGTIEELTVQVYKIPVGFDVAERILDGFDRRLKPAIVALGITDAQFDACASGVKVSLPFAMMPLRDAIDAVHFLIYTTIKLHRYNGATPAIGGAIEIAAITADRGFRWILHKPFTESIGILHGKEVL